MTIIIVLLHLWEMAFYICSRQQPLGLHYSFGFITLNAADFYYICGHCYIGGLNRY